MTANLRDLFGDEADQLATSRSNIPVLTCLHLTGMLSSPILSFALEFPQSDQAIQQQVRQIINTDEMLMRQVIYLLVFGRFFTPDYMSISQYATLNSTYSLLSSTVTSQINAWLSKLTDILTLGVAIRSDGEGAGSSSEYEAQFQLQPVDHDDFEEGLEDAPLQDGTDVPAEEAAPQDSIEVEGVTMTFEKPSDTQLDLF